MQFVVIRISFGNVIPKTNNKNKRLWYIFTLLKTVEYLAWNVYESFTILNSRWRTNNIRYYK